MSQVTKPDSNWLIRIAHSLFIIAIIPLMLTGLRIAVANEPALIRLSMLLPQGQVHYWHFLSAAILGFACALYLVARLWRRRLPRFKHPKLKRTWFNATYFIAWALLTLSVTSGIQLLMSLHLLPIEWTLRVHLITALCFAVYIIAHTLLAFLAMPWTQVVRVFSLAHQPAFIAITCLSLAAGLTIFLSWLLTQPQTLDLVRTTQNIELDGDLREADWSKAGTVKVQTYQGYGQPKKGTKVTIKALHDDRHVYFHVSWPDPTRSQMHVPLIKTNEGWKVRQTDLKRANENAFYEDKLAILLSHTNTLAGAGTVQLGQQPIKDQPAPANARGLHYTTNGSIADVWHWKSVRTGLSLGQADDNYFGPATPSGSEYKRYTGGYQKDRDDCEHLVRWDGNDFQTKPECGGYLMNWTLYNDGIVKPLRLPADESFIKRLGRFDYDPNTSDFGAWWLDWSDTIAYHPDIDTYPLNTVIPSVLSLGPFTQGRGDVSAVGYWRDGAWQLEFKRAIDTQSEYDLKISNDTYLWVSTFDHSQTRHSYHIKPIRLIFH